MALLEILKFPDPKLRIVAKPVEQVDDTLQPLIDDMFETMYDANGIGLAATQVNVHQRVVVMDLSEGRDQPQVFINPEVTVLGDEMADYDEGCLSIPGFQETISRPTNISVKALDREGNAFEMQPDGLLAVCIQHELDHLNGKLFVDYLSALKRKRIKTKLEKQQKRRA